MKKIMFFKMPQIGLFAVLAYFLITTACVKEDLTTEVTTIHSEPQQLVSTTLYGRVIDESDQPIVNATVAYKSGAQQVTLTTDEDGYFLLRDVLNKGKSAYLTVQHTGKFEAFRRFSVLPDKFNYTEIKMNDKTIVGQVTAANGGTLNHESGAQITLPANGIIDESGTAYNGNVEVAMAWIDPSAEDLSQRMVGDLSGIDAEGQVRSLGTFGMLQVELLDAGGNELNLADGAESTLVFPVPPSLQGNAPDVIPLWSYDEERGTWIQEGEAALTGGEYVGVVSHFSSWNVDCLTDPIEISGQVLWTLSDGGTSSPSYLSLYVCGDKFGQKGGWLSNDGEFLFYNFPKDEVFELKIYDSCSDLLLSRNLWTLFGEYRFRGD